MPWVMHDSSLHEDPSDDEQSHQVHPHGGSGQATCVQCMMDSGTLQGEGGDTLVPYKDNGGKGGIETGENEVGAHPGEKKCKN